MELVSCFVFLAFLAVPLLIFSVKHRSPSSSSAGTKLPPGPWMLPVIGSMHHFLRGSKIPQRKLLRLSRSYGPLMYLKLGELDTIVVSSAEAAAEVTKAHDLHFAGRPDSVAMKIVTYGMKDIVFAPYGDYWRQMRKICVMELLSVKRVHSFRSVREEEVAKLVAAIRSAAAAGTLVDLTKMVATFTSNMMSSAAFGRRCTDREEFLAVVNQVKEVVLGLDLADFFPSLGFLATLSGIRRKSQAYHREIDRIGENILREHRRKMKGPPAAAAARAATAPSMTSYYEGQRAPAAALQEAEEEDLVDVLLRLQEQGGLEFPLTDDSISSL